MTKPLCEPTQQDVEWCWKDAQITALSQLKEAVTRTLVLRYYNLNDEVTLQSDASKSGLGAALLQNGQPVAYASRALTPAETCYAQIEEELLAIVFACERFDTYIYGRDVVAVETDKALGGHCPQSTQLSTTTPSVNAPSPSTIQLRDKIQEREGFVSGGHPQHSLPV